MPLRAQYWNGTSNEIITTNILLLCAWAVPSVVIIAITAAKGFFGLCLSKKKVKKNTIITATPLRKGVEENIKKIITTNILLLCAWVQNKIKNKPASRCRTKMAKELNFSLPTKKNPITTNKKKPYHYRKKKGVKGHMYHSVLGLCESAALSYTITVVGKKCAG